MSLRTWQWNEIFDAVRAAGLNPEEFDRALGADESSLRHPPSGAYFVIGGVAGNYWSRELAGEAPVEERTALSLQRLLQQLELWLGPAKRDIDMPDLWGEIERQRELLETVSDEAFGNTPFTRGARRDRRAAEGAERSLGEADEEVSD